MPTLATTGTRVLRSRANAPSPPRVWAASPMVSPARRPACHVERMQPHCPQPSANSPCPCRRGRDRLAHDQPNHPRPLRPLRLYMRAPSSRVPLFHFSPTALSLSSIGTTEKDLSSNFRPTPLTADPAVPVELPLPYQRHGASELPRRGTPPPIGSYRHRGAARTSSSP